MQLNNAIALGAYLAHGQSIGFGFGFGFEAVKEHP